MDRVDVSCLARLVEQELVNLRFTFLSPREQYIFRITYVFLRTNFVAITNMSIHHITIIKLSFPCAMHVDG